MTIDISFGTGTRYGDLTHVAFKGKKWVLICECGEIVEKWPSNVRSGRTTSCGKHGHGAGRKPVGVPISYMSMHARLRRVNGSASRYLCRCGAKAADWSYNHGCEQELWGTDGKWPNPLPYCEHQEHYTPLCKTCHAKKDYENACQRRTDKTAV